MRPRTHLMAVMLMGFAASAAFAQGPPIVGTADVHLDSSASSYLVGESFTVDLHVDLTGITGTCDLSTVPAVLNAYVIPVDFDSTLVAFVSASACDNPQFSATPTFTAPGTANANESVIVSSTISNSSAPTGDVCVATLTFDVVGDGEATLTPDDTDGSFSLSSAFQDCDPESDPTAIPGTGSPLVITLLPDIPIPGLNVIGITVLTILLALMGVAILRR